MMDEVENRPNRTRPKEIVAAILNDDLSLFNRAVAAGEDPEGAWFEGKPALHLCAFNGSHRVLSRILSDFDLDPWARDLSGRLAIDHALAKSYYKVYEMLDRAMYPSGWWKRP